MATILGWLPQKEQGGPQVGPALSCQLSLSDRLLLGRFLHGGAGVGSGVASGSGGVTSRSCGVASGASSRVGGVSNGFAGSVRGDGSGIDGSAGGLSSSVRSLAGLDGGVLGGFLHFFLLGAASKGQGREGGGKDDLGVHVQFPVWT